MEYQKFKAILNKEIFEESKPKLIENIAKYPGRYIGLFRPTKPKTKIIQNLLQSHEIRFGNAFEILIEEYLRQNDFSIINKKLHNNNANLMIDQCFSKDNTVYFIEQKLRDDHDSSKKRGQIQNFENKLNEMLKIYNEVNLVGIFYFLDPELKKNIKYYKDEIYRMKSDYGVKLHLFYGGELFSFLKLNGVWEEILVYLKKWKTELPEMPEINFDLNADISFKEIKDINPTWIRTILKNDVIFKEIIMSIFPEKKTLVLLLDYYEKKSEEKTIYRTLYDLLKLRIS